tara:strand:- start:220 stop:525 length:306 start_codon:yes stop_codon:yes gene_type:complete
MAETPKHYKLDRDLIFKLATLHCSLKEIADCVGTSVTTLEKRYSGIIDKGRSEGKKSLRRAQMEKALQGDVRMLIWLGKQYLEQKDTPTDQENTAPLPWEE